MGKTHKHAMWVYYSADQTRQEKGPLLLETLVAPLESTVNVTVHAGTSQMEQVNWVARQATPPVPIDRLPAEFANEKSVRGTTIFRPLGQYFEEVARNHKLSWWFSAAGLVMGEIARQRSPRERFDDYAGKLLGDAYQTSGRLSRAQYRCIMDALDEAGFKLKNELEAGGRQALAKWNADDRRKPIRTFAEAMEAKLTAPRVRRALQKRLSRALCSYKQRAGLA